MLRNISVQNILNKFNFFFKKNVMQKVNLNQIKCSYKKFNENLWRINKH